MWIMENILLDHIRNAATVQAGYNGTSEPRCSNDNGDVTFIDTPATQPLPRCAPGAQDNGYRGVDSQLMTA